MAKKLNARCPLQAECERKCAHEGHELDCDYYHCNARDELVIEDQEAIRRQREREQEERLHEELLATDDCEDPEEGGEKTGAEAPVEEHIADTGKMVMLPIGMLHPHPDNPRKELGDLTELADSLRAKGVFQNLTVVPFEDGYRIIIGHRRRAASELAGLTHLPCVIVDMTPKEQVETMLLENMQREDLTPYEQAQGFQMMIDMGDTVDEIVQKTGFSKKTVRRRLKMAELDPTILKEVSCRQISMEDFDTLAKIDDIKVRNECLKNIGTANFTIEVQKKIKKQNIAKNLPWVKNAIRALKAKKIAYTQTYYGDFSQIGEDIQIDELKGGKLDAPDPGAKKLHYYLDEDTGRLRFYLEREKPAPVRRSQEEIDLEKAQLEANEKCAELSALCHKLRSEFVKKLTYGSKNQREMQYRAKRKNDGGWTEGALIPYGNEPKIIHAISVHPEFVDSENVYYCEGSPVNPDTVCRFTGMYDNTEWDELTPEEQALFLYPEDGSRHHKDEWRGKKIFENDIVRVTDDDGNISELNSDTGLGRVVFCFGMWYITNGIENSLFEISSSYYIRVIGNMYDIMGIP